MLLARSAELAEKLPRFTEEEAAKYGLMLSRTNTVRLAYNSDAAVTFQDGSEIPRANTSGDFVHVMDEGGGPGNKSGSGLGRPRHGVRRSDQYGPPCSVQAIGSKGAQELRLLGHRIRAARGALHG